MNTLLNVYTNIYILHVFANTSKVCVYVYIYLNKYINIYSFLDVGVLPI